ncbi:MAG: type II 3-dehydroquinate dehydratase [candidate division Zixibacteria bacterium]|nr:type II 3-dehydroquinate dehydratase [candidate division Zixibacteria bacterium]
MRKILIIHGPNLNLLGKREPDVYGKLTLAQINALLRMKAKKLNFRLKIRQTNSELVIIELIQRAVGKFDGVVINPAAYTHYSYAIYDALVAVGLPTVEVHLSNIHEREPFRRKSVIAPACLRQIFGLGYKSYFEGLDFLSQYLRRKRI